MSGDGAERLLADLEIHGLNLGDVYDHPYWASAKAQAARAGAQQQQGATVANPESQPSSPAAAAAMPAAAPWSDLPAELPTTDNSSDSESEHPAAAGDLITSRRTRRRGASPRAAAAAAPKRRRAPPASRRLTRAGRSSGAVRTLSVMSSFLDIADRSRLLTAEEECQVAALVARHQQLGALAAGLAAARGRAPTDAEVAAAAGAAGPEALRAERAAGAAAKQLLLRSNMRLVVSVAKRFQNMGLGFADLIIEGLAGLERAAAKFDPAAGSRFGTYGYWWVRQACMAAVTEQGRLVRLPRYQQELLTRAARAAEDMESGLRRAPSVAEVAEEVGADAGRLEGVYGAAQVGGVGGLVGR